MSNRRRGLFAPLARAIDARAPRERGLLMVVGVLVLLAGWFYQVFEPLQARLAVTATAIETAETSIRGLKARRGDLSNDLARDLNAEKREAIAELEAELEALQERLAGRMPDFIEPERMRGVLEGMLAAHDGIKLIRMERSAPEKVVEPTEEQVGTVYRHTVRLVVEADYRQLIRYLREVEELQWQFMWSALDYRVEHYPKARVTLELQTFGGQEAWLGV
ncbi:MAG: hypothetical protein ACQERR_08940 [Pseudomonadota bacterium]